MPRKSILNCACQQCGKTFHGSPSEIARGWARFCSHACSRLAARQPVTTRLWSHVDRTHEGCWIYTGTMDQNGYGVIGIAGGTPRRQYAHRVAWELENGPIPDGLFVCHNCPGGDNPACIRPSHLFLAPPAGNSADMAAKGRQAYGERNGGAKLTEAEVIEIRRRYHPRVVTAPMLMAEYGVSEPAIRRAVDGRGWKHLPMPTDR